MRRRWGVGSIGNLPGCYLGDTSSSLVAPARHFVIEGSLLIARIIHLTFNCEALGDPLYFNQER